jgi:phosphoesterase RecJ-like protein
MKTKISTETYTLVADRLRSARRILAVTHINPDGDALGSLCFFTQMMRSIGIDCVPYCAGPMPDSLEFLPGFSEIISDKKSFSLNDFDLIVSLDCATAGRTNLEMEISKRRADQTFIEIDHHPASYKVSDIEARETSAASTTEILWHLATATDFVITPDMAKCLLTGLVTDTAHFIHPSVSQTTVTTAAALLKQGANLFKISDQISQTKTITAFFII